MSCSSRGVGGGEMIRIMGHMAYGKTPRQAPAVRWHADEKSGRGGLRVLRNLQQGLGFRV